MSPNSKVWFHPCSAPRLLSACFPLVAGVQFPCGVAPAWAVPPALLVLLGWVGVLAVPPTLPSLQGWGAAAVLPALPVFLGWWGELAAPVGGLWAPVGGVEGAGPWVERVW